MKPQEFMAGYMQQLRTRPGRTIAASAIPVVGGLAVASAGRNAMQRDASNLGEQNYELSSAYDSAGLTGNQMMGQIDRRSNNQMNQQVATAKDMASFNRGIGRDLLNQESDKDRALQGQQLRSNEAQNLLNNYTQRLANNQSFISGLMSGNRYS